VSLLDRARQFLSSRRDAYRTTFRGPLSDIVLKDLAGFCFANTTTFIADDRAHALAEGRRQVFLRITNHLNLSPDELWKLFDGRTDDVS
jgi:hypothetical protein